MPGGSGGKKEDKTKEPATIYGGSLPATAQTFQPQLPGFQDMLVNQLMAGFGGSGGIGANGGSDLVSLLSQMYRPMTTYSYAPKPPTKTEK